MPPMTKSERQEGERAGGMKGGRREGGGRSEGTGREEEEKGKVER